MQNQLTSFQSEEFGLLEVLLIDGKPYFPAIECAKILGYSNPHDAIKKHCRSLAKCEVPHPQNPRRTIKTNFIPEGDLYRLIIRSKLPLAERFEKFVFDEVLPSIRKHGAYLTDEILELVLRGSEPAFQLFQELRAEKSKTAALSDKLEMLAPKVNYCDLVLQSSGAMQVSVIAKDYGMGAATFNRLLHSLGIQYKINTTWLLYQRYADQGYTNSRTYCTSGGACSIHTQWTQKGRLFLYETLAEVGIFPVMESEHMVMYEGRCCDEAYND